MNNQECDELIKLLNDWEYDHLQMMERDRIIEYQKSFEYKNELRIKKLGRVLENEI